MITPSFSPTATERVLPKLALDFTTASLDSRVTLTRALNTATCVNSFGNVAVVNADLPRFDYDPVTLACKGLLIEESRINSITNNTMVGAVAGTPGTIPTGWSYITTQSNGLSYSIVGTGTENGISYLDVRFFGTTVNTNTCQIQIDAPAAATGQTWTASTYWKLAAGSKSGNWNIGIIEQTSGGGFVTGQFYLQTAPTSAALITQRPAQSRVLSGGATVAKVAMLIQMPVASGVAYDWTLRIGLPQFEQGAFATSVIQTSSGAVTRNADVATMTGTNFSSWYNQTEGTFVATFDKYAADKTGTLWWVDDGSTANFMATSGHALVKFLIEGQAASVYGGSITSGTIVANTQMTGAAAYSTTTTEKASLNGVAATTGSITFPSSGITRAYLGRQGNAVNYLNGHLYKMSYYPQALTAAEVQAFSK